MFRSFRLPWLGVALVLVLVAGALGGVAIAQIDGGDEYTGCLTNGGSINKVAIGDEPLRPCPQNQTEISWNQTGPPGPSGLSQAFSTDNFGSSPPLLEPGDVVDVATLDLPAGNYVLNTDITISEETPAEPPRLGGSVQCRFVQEDGTESRFFGAETQASEGTENWTRLQPFFHPGGDIVVRCEHQGDGTGGPGNGAIRLGILFNALTVDEVFYQH